MEHPDPRAEGFPRVYAVVKWTIIGALTVLALAAAAFWTMVLGGFAASGFRARAPISKSQEVEVTPECAWPYKVSDPDAKAVCRLFYNLSAEERAEVLKARQRR